MDQDFYSIKEFAAKLRVSEHTIRRSIRKGRINAFRVGSSDKSSYRIAHSELARMGIVDLQKLIKQLITDGKTDLVKE
jgi:excisionase family DNA binding protein